jgi:hypothetical protein
LIHTPEVRAKALALTFIRELEMALGTYTRAVTSFLSPALQKQLNANEISAVYLISSLLRGSKEIMVQKKVKIARTRDGTLAEVRLDFATRGALNASLRWSYDVGIDYRERALKFFRELWNRAPPAFRLLSGGADLVFLEDGSVRLLELNLGGDSGFMHAVDGAIAANLMVSNLLKRPTPLIARLNAVALASLEDQIAYLKTTIPRIKALEELHTSIDQMYLPDVIQYLRDAMIEHWLKNPTRAQAHQLSARFQAWVHALQNSITDRETRKLLDDMVRFGEDYMNQVMARATGV